MRTHALEAATQRIGREIFARAEAASPSVCSTGFWQQWAMNWLTQDEDLKLRIFRFIEVLPALRNDAAIARHLTEYLRPDDGTNRPLPRPLELALAYTNPASAAASAVAAATRFACGRMGRQFIAGSTHEEAIASVLQLRRCGMAFTLDLLGETIIADRVAREHQQRYIEMTRELSRVAADWAHRPVLDQAPWGPLPRVNISIKLSAIVTRFDAADPDATTRAVLNRLRPIMRTARDRGAFLNIDMEHYAVKDLTLELYKRVLTEPAFRDWPDCGLVIQCYLPDGEADMRGLIDWTRRRGVPITVRLVKGAYWDSETARAVLNGWPVPVYTRKWESDAAFERAARLMLENADIIRPAFASHNVRSIAAVLAHEEALGLPPRTVEFQMLTGMGDPLKRAMVAMKQRLRVYAPFGDLLPGMAYFIRRLIENTSNESFLRQSFGEQTPIEELLQEPTQVRREDARDPRFTEPGSVREPSSVPMPLIQDPDEYAEMNPFENETDVDFSRPENRQAMEASLQVTRKAFGRKYPAIINNAPVETGQWFESRNPSAPEQVIGLTAVCDAALADRAVAAARSASAEWAATPAEQRAGVLTRAADRLHQRRFEAAGWLVYEAGKTWVEAQGDIMETVDYLRFYAFEMRRLSGRARRRDYPGESNEYTYRPRGVVLVISPFCFPMALLTGKTAAALVTGNTVVAKPAPAASVCAAFVVDLLTKAGLPPGVLNFVPGRGEEIVEYLVQHPGVDMIAFTGSRAVGSRIIESTRRPPAGGHAFKHVIAEMGAKNAIIIDDDADLDVAVQATIASAFGYSGQKCSSCSRVIVLAEVYEDFLSKLVEAAGGVQPAPADLPGTTVGPLIDAATVERARRYIEIGKGEARCVLEGQMQGSNSGREEPAPGGHFLPPVIFADVPPDARIAQEEILAPILAVIRAEDFDDAIKIANGTPYALTGGVFSRSPRNIEQAKRRVQAGVLYVNRRITVSRVDRQPFGGLNMSGLGTKTGGPDYLQQFMIPCTISENTMRHGFQGNRELGFRAATVRERQRRRTH